MLYFKILDERNTSTVTELDEYSYYEGEDRTLRVRVINSYDDTPYIIAAAGTLLITYPGLTARSATIDGTDRSVATLVLVPADTTLASSGDLLGEITEDTKVRVVKAASIIKKLQK